MMSHQKHHRTIVAGTRTRLVAAAIAAAAQLATAQTTIVISGSSVDSDGRQQPHSSSVFNGVLNSSYAGSDFPAGEVTIQGSVSQNAALSWASQLRYSILNLTTGNVYHSHNVNNSQTWSSIAIGLPTNPTMVVQDASSLGTIHNGDSLQVRFYESWDEAVGPDAVWSTVTLTLKRRPPSSGGLGQYEAGPLGGSIDTSGSGYDTVIGIYDPNGLLIGINDDGGLPGGASYLSLDGLPPGEYYLCCAGSGASLNDGFDVAPLSPGGPGGDLTINHPNGTELARTHDDAVAWYRFEMIDAACEGDVNGDSVVNITDLGLMLANFGVSCP
jgi:hypothetical protein